MSVLAQSFHNSRDNVLMAKLDQIASRHTEHVTIPQNHADPLAPVPTTQYFVEYVGLCLWGKASEIGCRSVNAGVQPVAPILPQIECAALEPDVLLADCQFSGRAGDFQKGAVGFFDRVDEVIDLHREFPSCVKLIAGETVCRRGRRESPSRPALPTTAGVRPRVARTHHLVAAFQSPTERQSAVVRSLQ